MKLLKNHGMVLGCLLAGMILCGCSLRRLDPTQNWPIAPLTESSTTSKPGADILETNGGEKLHQVKLDGKGLRLGQPDRSTMPPEQLVNEVESRLSANRETAARRIAWCYPDVTLEALRSEMPSRPSSPAVRFLAQVHDEQMGGQGRWSSLARSAAENPKGYRSYDQARRRLLSFMQTGLLAEAAQVRLPESLPQEEAAGPLRVDAWQLQGSVLLATGKFAEADRAFGEAMGLASSTQERAHLLLLQSEALRRLGKIELADKCWEMAVAKGIELVRPNDPVCDVGFWERCAYLRPVHRTWPEELVRSARALLVRAKVFDGTASQISQVATGANTRDGEMLVFAMLGAARLDRNESESALVSLKRAEAACVSQRDRFLLQLAQARTLTRMNQPVPALAILSILGASTDSVVAAEALALMGAVKLQSQTPEQAFGFLLEAMKKAGNATWPGRAEASANLGLAFLISGHETEGLNWLHKAQQEMVLHRDSEAYAQCLENEARYLEAKGRTAEAALVRSRHAEVNRTAP